MSPFLTTVVADMNAVVAVHVVSLSNCRRSDLILPIIAYKFQKGQN